MDSSVKIGVSIVTLVDFFREYVIFVTGGVYLTSEYEDYVMGGEALGIWCRVQRRTQISDTETEISQYFQFDGWCFCLQKSSRLC
jgi:hypothetical protein